jgi:xylulose-5-phosphate/fructose-6-phosphate phosphoketolase
MVSATNRKRFLNGKSLHFNRFLNPIHDRVSGLATRSASTRRIIREKLYQLKQNIDQHGEDLPEIRDWKWKG